MPAWPPPEEGFEETPSCTHPSFLPSPSTRLLRLVTRTMMAEENHKPEPQPGSRGASHCSQRIRALKVPRPPSPPPTSISR